MIRNFTQSLKLKVQCQKKYRQGRPKSTLQYTNTPHDKIICFCVKVELCGEQEDAREDPHYLVSVTTQDPSLASQHRSGKK